MVGSTVICSPEHLCDPALAIAAVRAGEIGLLDLGYEVEGAVRREALGRLASLAGDSTAWGVRWQTWARADRMPEVLAGLWEEPVPKLLIAGLDPETPATLRKALAQGRKIAREIWIEAYSVEQAEGAAGAGFDGVVLKGNESGGRVAADSAFLLLQAVRGRIECPCWVQGAWGPDTAAAAHLAGAAGIVLGEELWLARESPLAADGRRFESLDGSETVCLGEGRHPVRLFRQVDRETLQTFENGGDSSELWPEVLLERWRELAPHEGGPLPLGQGIAFARGLAERFLTVGGILQAYRDTIEHHLSAAPRLRALAPDGPMARVHGTLHPIVQGPMTRVSDTAPFARAVAENGGLPFLALALMRGPEVRELLRAVQQELGDLPWGVGVLGFVPPELRQEQLEVIREIRPRFGIIAGGRPGQAAEMEAEGIATYLHVPSPGLLETFLEQGARKFIFEGRECGGHVGPRSSLTLWQSAIDILCDAGLTHPEEIQVLFAGGVHDALSAAMVQTLAVPLTERGMKIGALMGTAYLFTPEAVATGAISEVFQEQAIACKRTALLESGVGHASRCAESPFAEEFREQRRALQKKGQPAEEVRFELEMLNVGRLRLASKGLVRRATDAEADASQSPLARGARMLEGELVEVDEKAQRSGGMFMMGQLAALREERQTMAELHEEVSRGSTDLLSEFARERVPAEAAAPVRGEPIAVVGMAGIFPDAPDLRAFWRNVVEGRDSVREVSESRWNQEQFFDPDRTARDRLYAVRGAFLQPLRLDPVRFRIPPATVGSVEPIQLLALEAARRALQDAGLDRRPFPRERAAVIFGSSGIHDVGIAYAFRTLIGHYLSRSGAVDEAECERIVEKVRDILPGWSEDSFPGILPNVISGRITNRLDLRGANYTIDAACSSALAAVHAAVEQLRAHTCDIALTGGVDSSNNAFTFMCFAKTHALTPGDKPRPFDANADGIVLGEGVGAVVLKRLKDAERDGDDIYAVIRGLGCSSDGRNRSLTAPHPDGQVLALRRAYEDAGVDPSSVALVEAHATGTTVGDAAEIEGLRQVFGQGGKGDCAIGSVKSQIGHAKSSAGIAGLIKAALAVRHGILPPTINVETPNPRVQEEDCPFYINTRCRPWIRKRESLPRRAGVSAFGFGGTNFHVVLESYESAFCDASKMDLTPRPAELFVWQRASRKEMTETVRNFQRSLEGLEGVRIDELAACLHGEERTRDASAVRLAIVAKSTDDLVAKCEKALEALRKDGPTVDPLSDLFLHDGEPAVPAQVAFLFPGQGAQRVDMLADLVQFGSFGSELFTAADRLLADYLPQPLSRHIFPPPAFGKKAQRAQEEILKDTRIAQPAVGVVDLFAQDVLEAFGLYPSFAGGHSYGEYVALCAARACTREELLILSAKRGQAVHEVAESGAGGMAAANADAETVESALKEFGIPALIANFNAPKQTIIGGPREAIDAALEQLPKKGLAVRRVAVSAAFHTPAVKEASETIAVELDRINLRAPEFPVFSNVTAAPYPGDVPGVKALLNKHLAHPVRFVEQIEAMYEAGARVFVEAGPGRILTGLVKRILADKPHTTLALDMPGQPSWLPLGRLLAHAFAIGLPLDLAAWHRNRRLGGRSVEDYLAAVRLDEKGSPTDWWVDPAGSRPVRQPTPSPAKLVKGPEPAETPMKKQPASTPAPKAPPPTAGSPDLAGRLQEMTAQWLELQREQQRLTERFLALQERLLDAHLGTAPAATAPIPGAATVAPVGLPVAPAPVLPALDAAATEEAAPPAAPAPVRVAAEEEEDADAPPSVETFQRELVAEVSRRTGYPEDMLDLDLPLEAGLGIDSIKVMEIFSALKRYHPFLADPDQDEEDVLAQFTQLKTLGDIIRHYEERRLIAPASVAGTDEEELAAVPDAAMEAPAPAPAAPTEVERLVVKSVPAAIAGEIDLQGDVLPLPKDQGLLILGDVPAFGAAIRTGLESAGYTAWQVVPAASGAKSSGDGRFYSVDLGSPEAVASFAASVREEGKARVGAILNLLNLDEEFREPTLESADAALRLSRWLLCVAQAFEKDLRACAAEGGGLVVNVTSLDGRFGLSGNRPLPVAQAASIGFFKALAKEWREVRVKNLDVDPEAEPEILLTGLAGELSTGNGLIEVGFDTDGRWELDPSAASDGRSDEAAETADATEAASTEALPLDSESIVLCTGGAHGITADALRILASETHARLVIVGRSPRTTGDEEPDEIRNLVDAGGVREALIRKARADNGQLTPAEIEREVTRVLKNRAIRANLDAFEAAGSKVEYHTLDVRDEKALTEFIEKLYESHGRIDAVIHAAGVIEDHWIRDKTPESFARVFDTKVRPALVLARTLRPEGLKFVGFFSSVSARFGNAGQVDYSAANEVLNKLADHLDREWPGRVVSINWGPWDAGMVSEALRAAYAERGIGLISPSLGGRAFLEEVRRRDEHASEVVLACNIRRIARAGLGEPAS